MDTVRVADLRRWVVVDAANVVGSRPDGWWRDRAGAARKLVAGMAGLPERLGAAGVIVVLEGAARAAVPAPGHVGGLRVVLADDSGDDAIVGVVAEVLGSGPITVVTADRELRARVEALGAETVGPRWLRDLIE